MPKPLNDLERRIFDFLVDYVRRNTYQPSIRELGRHFRIKSTKTVSELLQSLADKGWVERDPSRSRGVRLLGIDLSPDVVSVPYFGEASPDAVTLAREGAAEQYQLDRRIAGESGTFLLSMMGGHLEAAGIHDGDLLLIEPVARDDVEDGDIVVVRRRGRALVTRYHERDGGVLESADAAAESFSASGADVSVSGRVICVVRRLRGTIAGAAETARSGRPAGRGAASS